MLFNSQFFVDHHKRLDHHKVMKHLGTTVSYFLIFTTQFNDRYINGCGCILLCKTKLVFNVHSACLHVCQ